MDGRRFIDTMFSSEKGHSITQVIMNLPNTAVEFLGLFSTTFTIFSFFLVVVNDYAIPS